LHALAKTYWDLIRGAKRWLAVTIGLFAIAFVAGIVVGLIKPAVVSETIKGVHTDNLTGFADFSQIATHNVKSMLIMWGGGLILGILPMLETVFIGFAGGGLLARGPFGFWFLGIVPHSVIELPTMLLSNAFFLRFGLRALFQKDPLTRRQTLFADFRDCLKIALPCAVLFVVAASIEAFGTANLLDTYNNEYYGKVGIRFEVHDKLTIATIIPGGPAEKAGLSTNLLIQKIDGVATAGKSAQECADMTHGRVGTIVKLEVIDVAHRKTNTVDLVRALKR
jgi:uncharacterized membrane protein SpoIIM required for sporulation